jgi:hypothetical protein
MARRSKPQEPQHASLTVEQMRNGVKRITKRIEELEQVGPHPDRSAENLRRESVEVTVCAPGVPAAASAVWSFVFGDRPIGARPPEYPMIR